MLVRIMYQFLFFSPFILLCLNVIFKATLYQRMPVSVGDPYGIGDIIEALLALLLLASCALTLLFSLLFFVIPAIKNNRYALRLLYMVVGTALLFFITRFYD